MIGDVFQHVGRHRVHVGEVRVVDARPRPIRRARHVMLRAARLFPERLHPLHDEIRLRQPPEILRQRELHLLEMLGREINILLRPRIIVRQVELLVRAHEGEELLQRAFEARLFLHLLHLRLDARDFRQAKLVDLVRRHVGRSHQVQHGVVIRLAIWQRARALRRRRSILLVFGHPRRQPIISRLHLVDHGEPKLLGQRHSLFRLQLARLSQRLDLGLAVGKQRGVLALVERRARRHALHFVGRLVIAKARHANAISSRKLRPLDQYIQRRPDCRYARDVGIDVRLLVHAMLVDHEVDKAGVRAVPAKDVTLTPKFRSLLGPRQFQVPDLVRKPRIFAQRFRLELGLHVGN